MSINWVEGNGEVQVTDGTLQDKFKENPCLCAAGMIKRTKYSRLHNDSPTSPEDQPPTMSPQKRELDQDSETARVSDGTSCHHGPSLRDFFPCVAKIRLHSPVACLKGQRDTAKDTTTTFYGDNSKLQHGQRLCGQSPPHVPLCTGRNKTKRAITLHRMVSLPRIPSFASCSTTRGGQCSLKNSCAADDGANTAVHYDIKVMVDTGLLMLVLQYRVVHVVPS